MCVAAVAWLAHPRWRLVAIGNRDEYHERPATPLERRGNGTIAGRDLQSGGTWLGVSEATSTASGRFVLVTNLRGFGLPDPAKVSRGSLVEGLLGGNGPYADPARAPLEVFNPFNLIVADGERATFLTNRPDSLRAGLGPGLYGLSNGTLDEPWPKTLQLKAALLGWIEAEEDGFDPLFAALRSEVLAAGGLPPHGPSEVPAEPAATPPFIRNPVYGTRCSTVVAIEHSGQGGLVRGRIAERRFDLLGDPAGDTVLSFRA